MYPWQFVNLSADGQVKASQGQILGFLVNKGTPTLTIYDSLTAAGTKIVDALVCVAGQAYPLGCVFQKGLYVDMTNPDSVTFIYR